MYHNFANNVSGIKRNRASKCETSCAYHNNVKRNGTEKA